MFRAVRSMFKRRPKPMTREDLAARIGQIIRAKYDAAQTTGENRRHWGNADKVSPVADAASDVRAVLRSRARYEVANNSIARGIVLTLANDVVGRGPRLQFLTEAGDLNRAVEAQFANWSAEVRLGEKLRTMRKARAQDGEAFGVLVTNRSLRSPVKLDLRLIEADRVSTPTLLGNPLVAPPESRAVDGIVFDEDGNPAQYHILRAHPGSSEAVIDPWRNYDTVPADQVIHWFRTDRPEQRRGIPDLTPALPLFALLRRFTLATLVSAEIAADLSLIMNTNAPAGGEAAEVEPWIQMEISRGMVMFAPEGWTPSQLKAENPSETFEPFRKAIINEIARCLNMPYNVAACNSSDYNYASGRLDHQTYFKSIRVERSELEAVVLDRLVAAWLQEAMLSNQFSSLRQLVPLRSAADLAHQWFWDGWEHVDPLKEAKAAEALLKIGLLTEADYCGRQGLDWEEQQRQREREAKGRIKRGLPSLEPGLPAGTRSAQAQRDLEKTAMARQWADAANRSDEGER